MALLLYPTGEQEVVLPDFGREDFTAEQLVEFTGGALEVKSVRRLGKDMYVVVNPEGCDRDERFNSTASFETRVAVFGKALLAHAAELGKQADA